MIEQEGVCVGGTGGGASGFFSRYLFETSKYNTFHMYIQQSTRQASLLCLRTLSCRVHGM